MSSFPNLPFPSHTFTPTSDPVLSSSDEERDVAGPITPVCIQRKNSRDLGDRARARSSFDSISGVWGTTSLGNVPEEQQAQSPLSSALPSALSGAARRFSVVGAQKSARSQSYSVGQRAGVSSLFGDLPEPDFPGRLLPDTIRDEVSAASSHSHRRRPPSHGDDLDLDLTIATGGYRLNGLGAHSATTPGLHTAPFNSSIAHWPRSAEPRPFYDPDCTFTAPTPTDSYWQDVNKGPGAGYAACRSPSDSNSVLSSVGYSPTEQSSNMMWSSPFSAEGPIFPTSTTITGIQSRRHSVAVPSRFERSSIWGGAGSGNSAVSQPGMPTILDTSSFADASRMGPLSAFPILSTSSPFHHQPPPSNMNMGHYPVEVGPKASKTLYAVAFKCGRVDIYHLPASSPLRPTPGQRVIVEGDRGFDLGTVTHVDVPPDQADALKEAGTEASIRYLLGFSRQFANVPPDEGVPPPVAGAPPYSDRRSAISQTVVEIMAKRAAILRFKHHPPAPRESKFKAVRRLATPDEISGISAMRELEEKAVRICQSQVDSMGKPMEILSTEFQADYHKLTFYYFSDEYVDFNALVKCLFRSFKTRLWMSAINPDSFAIMAEQKEEARMERERERLEKASRPSRWNGPATSELVGLSAASSEFQRCAFAGSSRGAGAASAASSTSVATATTATTTTTATASPLGPHQFSQHQAPHPQAHSHLHMAPLDNLSYQMGQMSMGGGGGRREQSQNHMMPPPGYGHGFNPYFDNGWVPGGVGDGVPIKAHMNVNADPYHHPPLESSPWA